MWAKMKKGLVPSELSLVDQEACHEVCSGRLGNLLDEPLEAQAWEVRDYWKGRVAIVVKIQLTEPTAQKYVCEVWRKQTSADCWVKLGMGSLMRSYALDFPVVD